jgi:hypothetical protein
MKYKSCRFIIWAVKEMEKGHPNPRVNLTWEIEPTTMVTCWVDIALKGESKGATWWEPRTQIAPLNAHSWGQAPARYWSLGLREHPDFFPIFFPVRGQCRDNSKHKY